MPFVEYLDSTPLSFPDKPGATDHATRGGGSVQRLVRIHGCIFTTEIAEITEKKRLLERPAPTGDLVRHTSLRPLRPLR